MNKKDIKEHIDNYKSKRDITKNKIEMQENTIFNITNNIDSLNKDIALLSKYKGASKYLKHLIWYIMILVSIILLSMIGTSLFAVLSPFLSTVVAALTLIIPILGGGLIYTHKYPLNKLIDIEVDYGITTEEIPSKITELKSKVCLLKNQIENNKNAIEDERRSISILDSVINDLSELLDENISTKNNESVNTSVVKTLIKTKGVN